MIVEKVKRDYFVSGSTSSETKASPSAGAEGIVISDKSKKELYLEELGKIIKHKSNKPIKIAEH